MHSKKSFPEHLTSRSRTQPTENKDRTYTNKSTPRSPPELSVAHHQLKIRKRTTKRPLSQTHHHKDATLSTSPLQKRMPQTKNLPKLLDTALHCTQPRDPKTSNRLSNALTINESQQQELTSSLHSQIQEQTPRSKLHRLKP
jgi:hypothetical protein